jgi:hypothetical protein
MITFHPTVLVTEGAGWLVGSFRPFAIDRPVLHQLAPLF